MRFLYADKDRSHLSKSALTFIFLLFLKNETVEPFYN